MGAAQATVRGRAASSPRCRESGRSHRCFPAFVFAPAPSQEDHTPPGNEDGPQAHSLVFFFAYWVTQGKDKTEDENFQVQFHLKSKLEPQGQCATDQSVLSN